MLRIVADISIIWRIWRIIFSGKIENYLVIHMKDKIAEIANRCKYTDHPADLADPVFRKNRKTSSYSQERQNSRCCGFPPDLADKSEKPMLYSILLP